MSNYICQLCRLNLYEKGRLCGEIAPGLQPYEASQSCHIVCQIPTAERGIAALLPWRVRAYSRRQHPPVTEAPMFRD